MRAMAWIPWLPVLLMACGNGNRETGTDGGEPRGGTTSTRTTTTTETSTETTATTTTDTSVTTGTTTGAETVYGTAYTGQYHLGPVDFAETDWHNACAPGGGYVSSLRAATGLGGEYLAGVQTGKIAGGANCDACIVIKTATGKAIVARVVTYGDTGANDLDVSPSVYAALNTGEYPRTTTWQWAKCPDTGNLSYEFQTEANVWWTSFWVRNPRVPVAKVEVQSKNHANFITLARGSDGTLTDASGFGEGAFTLRLTAVDGQTITDTFPSFTPGKIQASSKQFQ